MATLRSWFGFALALCLLPSAPVAQSSSTELTPAEMVQTALLALENDQPARALAVSEALLLRNPDDTTALRIAGRAALDARQSEAAIRHGRALFNASDELDSRHFAAQLIGLAHAQQDHFLRAQYWFRRAYQNAPDERAAAAAVRGFRGAKQSSPLHFDLNFGIAPSSNINNGSSEETSLIATPLGTFQSVLSADAKQLSGYEISLGGRLTYALSVSDRHRTRMIGDIDVSRYRLSSEAKVELAEEEERLSLTGRSLDFDVSDLDYERFEVGIAHDWLTSSNQLMNAQLLYATRFYGGGVYAREVSLGYATQWRFDENSSLRASVSVGRVEYESFERAANSWDAGLTYYQRFDHAHAVNFGITAGRSYSSDSTALEANRSSVFATYDFGTLWDFVDVETGIRQSWRSVGASAYAPDGREEHETSAHIAFGLPQAEIYGFSPVLRIEGSRNFSNVALYQKEGLTLDLSYRSNF